MTTQITNADDKRKALMKAVQDLTTEEEKAQALATALYTIQRSYTFYGSILQLMNIQYSYAVPTLGVGFNTDLKRYELYINPVYFVKALKQEQRVGVLVHEVMHITNQHLIRVPFMQVNNHKRKLLNIAGDMAINQVIKDLPMGCKDCPPIEDQKKGVGCTNPFCCGRAIMVDDYADEDATGNKVKWSRNKTMEHYYEKLIERYEEPEDDGEDDGEGDGDGEGDSGGAGSNGRSGVGNTPREFDSHNWQGGDNEKEVLDATEDLVKRAMVKENLSYDNLPGNVKELLDMIKARRSELNYKQLILSAIKRSATGTDRQNTWTRRNRRFGNKSPGTKEGDLPKLRIELDTSGSISTEELNEFLDIVDEFLKVGSRKCEICLFSDKQYFADKYKIGQREFVKDNVRMGGTDLTDSIKKSHDNPFDLHIIVTDGCYGDVKYEEWLRPGTNMPQILWVISKGGSENHPLKRLGDTIKVPAGG